MVEIELTEQALIIHLRGIYRFLGFRRRIACPLAHVTAVAPNATPALLALPFRATYKVGTRLPGLVIGGFGTRGDGRNFYALRTGKRAITIALEEERYAGLIVEVDDPAGMARAIGAAARRAGGARDQHRSPARAPRAVRVAKTQHVPPSPPLVPPASTGWWARLRARLGGD